MRESVYGYPVTDDPFDFIPDPEVTTRLEWETWRRDRESPIQPMRTGSWGIGECFYEVDLQLEAK